MVIYTSGVSGQPKGVLCSQYKILGAGLITWFRIGLRRSDRGYVCMPLFHSNSWYLGIMPILVAGGSFVLRRKFSASAFEEDLLRHGITYLNYVGQPVHYILSALERKHGSLEAVQAALSRDPRNRFRMAHGNGALPADREKLVRVLGMEHVFELYGSTEAPINTVAKPGDPPGSVGRVTSRKVRIVNERDQECPPGRVNANRIGPRLQASTGVEVGRGWAGPERDRRAPSLWRPEFPRLFLRPSWPEAPRLPRPSSVGPGRRPGTETV
jgi:fatty-acyl-CoA synthase